MNTDQLDSDDTGRVPDYSFELWDRIYSIGLLKAFHS